MDEYTRADVTDFIKGLPGVKEAYVNLYKKSTQRTFLHAYYSYGPNPRLVAKRIAEKFSPHKLHIVRLVGLEDLPNGIEPVKATVASKSLPKSLRSLYILNDSTNFS